MTDRVVFTVPEAAEYIGISKTTMYQWLAKRLIPHENLTPPGAKKRIIRVRKEDVDAYLNRKYVSNKPKQLEKKPGNVHGLFLEKRGAA